MDLAGSFLRIKRPPVKGVDGNDGSCQAPTLGDFLLQLSLVLHWLLGDAPKANTLVSILFVFVCFFLLFVSLCPEMRTIGHLSTLLLLTFVQKGLTEIAAPLPLTISIRQGLVEHSRPTTALDARTVSVKEKAVATKAPPIGCPEAWGVAPVICSDLTCGGADPNHQGYCNKTLDSNHGPCKCENRENKDGSSVSFITTIVQATVQGVVATATYRLETLPAYTKLRQKATVTTTASPTSGSSGPLGLETVAAVVFAGGVAWFPVGFAGEAAAAPEVVPPDNAPDHYDDKNCPNPEKKCGDCAGQALMCTTGPESGCKCEGSSCPAPGEDKSPDCSEKTCKGKDGKCTEGEHANCECKPPKEECPDLTKIVLPCEACGGEVRDGDVWKCKGIANENDKFKDCVCHSLELLRVHMFTPHSTQVMLANKEKLRNLPKRLPEHAVCQKAGWQAPQRDPDGSPSVSSKVSEWCAKMDGQSISKAPGVDTAFAMYQLGYWAFWLSASKWYSAPGDNKCEDTVPISKDECVTSLTKAMEACDPNSGVTHGAALPGKCIYYNITLAGGTNPNSPPWNPLPQSASPQCDTKQLSAVTYNFLYGLYAQFCQDVDKDKAKPLSKVLTNQDFKKPSTKRSLTSGSLQARTPPASSNQYPGYKFHFDWTGGEGHCREDCNGAFKKMIDSSCGHQGGQQNTMTKKGSMSVGCGSYSFEIEAAPPPVTCKPGETAPVGVFHTDKDNVDGTCAPRVNPRQSYFAAVHQFCKGGYNNTSPKEYGPKTDEGGNMFWFLSTSIDPATKLPAYCISYPKGEYRQWSPLSQKLCKVPSPKNVKHGVGGSDSKIILQVNPSPDQKGCDSLKDFRVPDGEECVKKFGYVIDQCMPKGTKDGTGGYLTEKSAHGCHDWWIWGAKLT